MAKHAHETFGQKKGRFQVITVSDTRTKENDHSGQTLIRLLEEAGHHLTHYTIVKDEKDVIKKAIQSAVKRNDVDVVLLTGGTGFSPRDVTYEVTVSLLDKEMPGFGELFRMLSYTDQIGASAMLSRAVAGTIGTTAVFSLPGSRAACQLAMKKLILPEVGHLLALL